jgi:hypothetical protein
MVVNSFLKIFEFWHFDVHEVAVCTRRSKASKSAPVAPILTRVTPPWGRSSSRSSRPRLTCQRVRACKVTQSRLDRNHSAASFLAEQCLFSSVLPRFTAVHRLRVSVKEN